MNQTKYLGRVPLARALEAQAEAVTGTGLLIGFECDPVVTLGLRGRVDVDVPGGEVALAARGLALVRVDRGGQATLHNPGQLVIFPVWSIAPRGSRAWVEFLIACTTKLARVYDQTLTWRADAPGLYDGLGRKVASVGVRVRHGISTHGIAINVRNDLDQFATIRPCGRAGQALAHLETNAPLEDLFTEWARIFLRDI